MSSFNSRFVLCQGSGRSNIILFLTDGNPNDAEAKIYQAIEEGQDRLVCNLSLNVIHTGMTHGFMNFMSDTISKLTFNLPSERILKDLEGKWQPKTCE